MLLRKIPLIYNTTLYIYKIILYKNGVENKQNIAHNT